MGKKILFITPGKPTGGSELLLANIVNATDTRNNDVMLVRVGASAVDDISYQDGVQCRNIWTRHRLDPSSIMELRRVFRDHRPQVVFCANYALFVWARMASVGLRLSCRYLITWHDDKEVPRYARVWYRLLTMLMSRRDELIMTTKRQVEHHARIDPTREGRVRIIRNGVDNQYWSPAPARFDRSAVRARLGVPDEAKLIIMTAALRAEYDHKAAVAALRVLCLDLQVDAHLLFVGTGVENGRIRLSAMNSGVKKRIHFLGFVRDLRELYWSSDMITLTAQSAEIFPKQTLEGMSCGLPVVATDRSGVAEFIEDGVNGFLSSSNPHDIAVKWHKTLRKSFSTKSIHQGMKKKVNLGRMTREYREALGVN